MKKAGITLTSSFEKNKSTIPNKTSVTPKRKNTINDSATPRHELRKGDYEYARIDNIIEEYMVKKVLPKSSSCQSIRTSPTKMKVNETMPHSRLNNGGDSPILKHDEAIGVMDSTLHES